jgi:hypothetical protein
MHITGQQKSKSKEQTKRERDLRRFSQDMNRSILTAKLLRANLSQHASGGRIKQGESLWIPKRERTEPKRQIYKFEPKSDNSFTELMAIADPRAGRNNLGQPIAFLQIVRAPAQLSPCDTGGGIRKTNGQCINFEHMYMLRSRIGKARRHSVKHK